VEVDVELPVVVTIAVDDAREDSHEVRVKLEVEVVVLDFADVDVPVLVSARLLEVVDELVDVLVLGGCRVMVALVVLVFDG